MEKITVSFEYDEETDVISIRIGAALVADTDEDAQGTIIDYDRDGNVVRIEILKASERMVSPDTIQISRSIHVKQADEEAQRQPIAI